MIKMIIFLRLLLQQPVKYSMCSGNGPCLNWYKITDNQWSVENKPDKKTIISALKLDYNWGSICIPMLGIQFNRELIMTSARFPLIYNVKCASEKCQICDSALLITEYN